MPCRLSSKLSRRVDTVFLLIGCVLTWIDSCPPLSECDAIHKGHTTKDKTIEIIKQIMDVISLYWRVVCPPQRRCHEHPSIKKHAS
mmetsp:Transcript_163/g.202  ORF Transcript_163/g.202 Transcript_163/m.202 type:complete len:86 (+) Transcript_163:787-1044(+)